MEMMSVFPHIWGLASTLMTVIWLAIPLFVVGLVAIAITGVRARRHQDRFKIAELSARSAQLQARNAQLRLQLATSRSSRPQPRSPERG